MPRRLLLTFWVLGRAGHIAIVCPKRENLLFYTLDCRELNSYALYVGDQQGEQRIVVVAFGPSLKFLLVLAKAVV